MMQIRVSADTEEEIKAALEALKTPEANDFDFFIQNREANALEEVIPVMQIRISADTENELKEALSAISGRLTIERWKRPKRDGSGRYKCYLFTSDLQDLPESVKMKSANKVPH